MSLIHSQHIVRVFQNHFAVKSQSEEGKWYQVVRFQNSDVWTCTCQGFLRRLRDIHSNKNCKHIISVKLYGQKEEKIIEKKDVTSKICPQCYTANIKKSGYRKLKNGKKLQRFSCLQCGFRFVIGGDGYRRMKCSPVIIRRGIGLVLMGNSYRDVKQHFLEHDSLRISHTTIEYWFRKYMKIITDYVDSILPPQLSKVWCLDETMLKVKNTKKIKKGFYDWMWTIIDPKTKLVIASEISKGRSISDARKIIQKGREKTGTRPSYIITDSLKAYKKAILREFGIGSVAHLSAKSFEKGFKNRPIERYFNEFKAITYSKRGLGNDKSAQDFADAQRTYHNFIRPHSGLPNNQTPAEAAGIDLKLGNNKLESLIDKSTEPEHKFAIHLNWRREYVIMKNEGDCIKVTPKKWLDKKIWREINDILGLYKFSWIKNGRGGSSWIKLKQQNLLEYCK